MRSGGELFRLGAGDDGRGDKSPSVHPYCRGHHGAVLPSGVPGQRRRFCGADGLSPLAGHYFCRQRLPPRRPYHPQHQRGRGRGGCPLTLNADNLRLFCLSYYPDSQIALQPEPLWQYDRQTVVRLFFALLSGRALPTPAAHQKREHLLRGCRRG